MGQRISEGISSSKLKTRGREGGAGKGGDTVEHLIPQKPSPLVLLIISVTKYLPFSPAVSSLLGGGGGSSDSQTMPPY